MLDSALDVLGPYLSHIQFKNVGWLRIDGPWQWSWMNLAEGMIDWSSLLTELSRREFDGWLSNENFLLIPPDRRPGPPVPGEQQQPAAPLVERLRADREWMIAAGG